MTLSAVPPAWLNATAPASDVALSTRCRIMRNLVGHRFPHLASAKELQTVEFEVLDAARKNPNKTLEPVQSITEQDREYMVGCRLISPEFAVHGPGRSLLLDSERSTSVMINEEDHLRVQGIAPGWNPNLAKDHVTAAFETFEELHFAWSPRFGYLAASPYNCGQGRRLSTMLHLIALAHTKRIVSVLRALRARNLTARGLFGESSRPVGAFLQVSMTDGSFSEFVGAIDYLVVEERRARESISATEAADKLRQSLEYLSKCRTIGLGDSLRILAWARLAANLGAWFGPFKNREIDLWFASLHLDDSSSESCIARARFLHKRFGL